jgi:hypothetical protein
MSTAEVGDRSVPSPAARGGSSHERASPGVGLGDFAKAAWSRRHRRDFQLMLLSSSCFILAGLVQDPLTTAWLVPATMVVTLIVTVPLSYAAWRRSIIKGHVSGGQDHNHTARVRAIILAEAVVSGALAVLALMLIWFVVVGIELGDVKDPVGSAFGAVIVGALGGILWLVARAKWRIYRRQT